MFYVLFRDISRRFGLKISSSVFKTGNATLISFKYSTIYSPNTVDLGSESSSLGEVALTVKESKLLEADLIWQDRNDIGGDPLNSKFRCFVGQCLYSFLSNTRNESFSLEKCAQLRLNISKQMKHKPERLLDSNILIELNNNDDWFEFAVLYVEYLTKKILFNPASVRIATDIIFKAFTLKKLPIDDSLTLKFLEYLNANFSRFNEAELFKFSCSLCTSKWRDSLVDLEKNAKLKSSRIANFRAAIICFCHDEPELGYETLQRFSSEKTNHNLTKPIFDAAFDCFIRLSLKDARRSLKSFRNFVEICPDYNSFGFHPVMEIPLRQLFKNLKTFNVKNTQISADGRCQTCSLKLNKISISDEEFKKIQNYLLSDYIMGEDVFRSSTPKEVNDFKKFLNKNGSFDVVVDGMNVLYREYYKYKRIFPEKLDSLVNELKSKGFMKICIFLRRHIFRDNPQLVELKSKAEIFLLDNKTVDDLFFLYAAAFSGSKCYIVSGDKFSFLSTAKLNYASVKFLLERWKRSRVISLDLVKDQLVLKYPRQHALTPQTNSNGFHIPLVKPGVNSISDEDVWLCMQQKNK